MPDTVKLDISDNLAVIILNRPDAMNAFTAEMGDEIIARFDQTDADPRVHAVVVTGAGRAFCAGADLSSGAAAFAAAAEAMKSDDFDDTDPKWRDPGGLVNLRIFDSQKPVVAALNGAAVGIGCTMSFPMDARVGLKGAKMAIPFSKRGIAWDGCASWFLPRIVGINTAVDWALSGRTFLADEAFEKGLLTDIQDTPDAVLEIAIERARGLISNTAPVSVAINRRLIWRMLGASHPIDAHRIETRAILHRGLAPDAAEGVMSFLEKRPPEFPGQVPADYPPGWPWDQDPEY
jgi:enoyl-CoA hydratase/carnithine racemase